MAELLQDLKAGKSEADALNIKNITCKYCLRDISRQFHIICADPICANGGDGVKLCGDCLHLPVLLHNSSHPYTVADCWQIPLFAKDWTINDELVLLAGIESYGMGNWKTIGEKTGLNRTARQIEEHYFEGYMGVHGYCLPAKSIVNSKRSLSVGSTSGKVQYVNTEAAYFSKSKKNSLECSNMVTETSTENAAEILAEGTEIVADEIQVEKTESTVNYETEETTQLPSDMEVVEASIKEAESTIASEALQGPSSDTKEGTAAVAASVDDLPDEEEEFPPDAVVSGCRIAVTQGYTRGTPVLRDGDVDKALGTTSFPLVQAQAQAQSATENGDPSVAAAEPQSTVKLGRGGSSVGYSEANVREKLAQLPGADLPGFIPLREDFDVEHANDAELLLAEMEFNVDDHPSERELKLKVIEIYNKKLEERNRRKRFVIDRGLIDLKQQQLQERRRSKEERELVGRLRLFARFQSAADHEALVEGVLRARRLRLQLELYRQYRAMGIRTLEQARLYEIDKRNRQNEQKLRKHKDSAAHLFQSDSSHSASGGYNWDDQGLGAGSGTGSGKRARRRDLPSEFDVFAGLSVEPASKRRLTGEDDEEFEAPNAHSDKRKGRKSQAAKPAAALTSAAPEDEDREKDKDEEKDEDFVTGRTSSSARRRKGGSNEDETQGPAQAQAQGPQVSLRRQRGAATDGPTQKDASAADQPPLSEEERRLQVVLKAPLANLLSDKEARLCAMVPLLPMHYLAAKEAIVREAYRNGSLTTDGLNRVFLAKNEKASGAVFDFFVKELRINEPSPALFRPQAAPAPAPAPAPATAATAIDKAASAVEAATESAENIPAAASSESDSNLMQVVNDEHELSSKEGVLETV